MWVTPYGFSFFERIYRLLSTKIIYDIEDNILIIKKNDINPINSIFKTQSKIRYLIKSSNNIIASSEQLAKECNNISKKNNSHYICASINIHRYNPNNLYNNSKIINVGWTGTFTSKIYLDLLKPLFINLSKRIKFKLIVISDFDYNIPGVDLEVIKWTKENEIKDLQKIDIGVYPLFDQWVSGKSGLKKALQYMAMALPTVATEVGNIKNVITHNHDGFLVENISEWEETITTLINNPDLRKKIGSNARKTVIENFSLEVNSIKYLNILKNMKKIKKNLCSWSWGMLGEAIYNTFKKKYELSLIDKVKSEKWIKKLNFNNQRYEQDVKQFNPDYLFHIGALTDLEYCEKNRKEAYLTNYKSVKTASKICLDLNIPLIFISTAGIFDGKKIFILKMICQILFHIMLKLNFYQRYIFKEK